MLKWLINNDANKQAAPAPAAAGGLPAVTAPTPSPASTQPRVMFVQAAGTAGATTPSATLPPPPPLPAATPTDGTPDPAPAGMPPLPPPAPSYMPAPAAPVPDAPVTPEATPTVEAPKEEKAGTIEMSNPMTHPVNEHSLTNPSELFAEAFEKTANIEESTLDQKIPNVEMTKEEEKPADKPVEMVTPEVKDEVLPQLDAPVETAKPSFATSAPELDLPDVSAEIKRILQERWITLANQQLQKFATRRDAIATQLAELENQQRDINSKRQALENERVEVMHTSEGWDAKLKEAQTTLDKVVQEVAAL